MPEQIPQGIFEQVTRPLIQSRDRQIQTIRNQYERRLQVLNNTKMTDEDYQLRKGELDNIALQNVDKIKNKYEQETVKFKQVQEMANNGTLSMPQANRMLYRLSGVDSDTLDVMFPEPGDGDAGEPKPRRLPLSPSRLKSAGDYSIELMDNAYKLANPESFLFKERPGRKIGFNHMLRSYNDYKKLIGYDKLDNREQIQVDKLWDLNARRYEKENEWDPNRPEVKSQRAAAKHGVNKAAKAYQRINSTGAGGGAIRGTNLGRSISRKVPTQRDSQGPKDWADFKAKIASITDEKEARKYYDSWIGKFK